MTTYIIEYARVIRAEVRAGTNVEAAAVARQVCTQFPKNDCKVLGIYPVEDAPKPKSIIVTP